jgi:hypothetical protein
MAKCEIRYESAEGRQIIFRKGSFWTRNEKGMLGPFASYARAMIMLNSNLVNR